MRIVILSSNQLPHVNTAKGERKTHFVHKVLRPGLEAVHLEAALYSLIGAHDGVVVVSPALLQRPSVGFT